MKIVLYKSIFSILLLIIFSINLYLPLIANNIEIKTVTVTDIDTLSHYANLMFDISWVNSWRLDGVKAPYNWDATWIFAKWKLHSGTDWAHCTLSSTDGDHTAPSGSTIDAASDGMGIFIYRSAEGSGSVDWDNVKLRWNYGTDIVADDATVDVKVFAIEMVYVPQGTFTLYEGECDNIYSNFNSGNIISNEEAIPEGSITWSVETNWCGAQTNDGTIGGCDSLCADFPKGYHGFYCMKYEISQGQYADFLSHLTETQRNNRYSNQYGNFQHTIDTDYSGNYYASEPDRACNYLSWADGLAYADWAGLRPMTELEYEKISRVSESIIISKIHNNDISENHSSYNDNNNIKADYNDISEQFSIPFYGVINLNGNLWERCITVAKYCWNNSSWNNETNVSIFDGQNGDGYLTKTGFSNVSNWPSKDAVNGYSAYGSSVRGACWIYSPSQVPVTDRNLAAYPYAERCANYGFRAVRTE